MKRKKCSTSVEYSVVQLSKTVDVSSVLTQAVGLNAFYFEKKRKKKCNIHDNNRTVSLFDAYKLPSHPTPSDANKKTTYQVVHATFSSDTD